MRGNIRYIAFLLCILLRTAFPQNYITHFNLVNGLSQTEINCITQDSAGFIWIGTQDGINRFDGLSFVIYQHQLNDSASLSNSYIRDLLCDGKFIWVATHGGGLNKFNTQTGKCINYSYNLNGSENFDNNIFTSIVPFGRDKLIIGTEGCGILIFDKSNLSFEKYSPSSASLRKNNILRLVKWNDSSTVAVTEADVYIFNINTKIFTPIIAPQNQNLTAVSRMDDNRVIAGSYEGDLFYIDIISDRFVFSSLGLRSASVKNIFCFDEDLLLIATDEGTRLLDTSTNQFVNPGAIKLPEKFENYKIKCLFKDRSNVTWLGSTDDGIYKIKPKYNHFISLLLSGSDCVNGNSVWCIYKDPSDNLWIGTDGCGLIVYNRKTGEKKKIIEDGTVNSISSNNISCVMQDDEGNYWIGTFGGGISVLKTNGKFVHYFHTDEKGTLSHNYVWLVYKSKDGSIWVGSKGGLDLFDRKSSKFINFKNIPNNNHSLSSNSILTIFEDSAGDLWFGTFGGGLNMYNRKTNSFIHYHHDENDKNSISNNSIMSIYEDIYGNLWLGTDNGLNKLDKKTKKITNYFESDGLANDLIYAVTGDREGNIWVSTNKGISKFSQTQNIFSNYNASDGLQDNEFNQNSTHTAPDGEIFFGGIKGLSYFYPDKIKNNPNLPNVAFTSIKIFDKELPLSEIYENGNSLKVSYFENYLQFEFAALEFTEPQKNMYKYKLEGFDREWRYSGKRRTAIYTNLDPGEYTLRVSASNNDCLWNEAGTALAIVVAPPFYMTWWARFTAFFFIGGMLYLMYRVRLKRLLDIEQLRLKIASDLHDEVGATLTSLSIQSQLLPSDREENKLKNRIKVIDELCRKIISTMSDIVWSIDSRNDSINDLVYRMKNLSFNMLNDKNINVQYKVDIEEFRKKLPIDIKQNLYLIFKEAFNNAVKYSNASEINILLSAKDSLTLEVSDNGCGLPDEFSTKGNGMRNMKMRAKIINAKLDIMSNDGVIVKLFLNLH